MAAMNGQEDTLVELLAANQLKQTLTLCEKRLKKTPLDDYLSAMRIKILIKWRDIPHMQQAIKYLEDLLDRKPPVADFEALRTMDEQFDTLERAGFVLTPKQRQTWQRAASIRPDDENLYTVWHRSKFDSRDFRGAQQVSTVKSLPNDHANVVFFLGMFSLDEEFPKRAEAILPLHPQHSPNFRANKGPAREVLNAKACAQIPFESRNGHSGIWWRNVGCWKTHPIL